MKNSKLLIVLLSVLLVSLGGCNVKNQNSKVKCSNEQLIMVDKQYLICTKTGYIDSYCYDQARVEQCDHVELTIKAN